ncbi:hypothetical protein [Azospirillum halopraeferens]|uniref:hypothetical protein n=1 Tax=Azospirillum halopraeferens TaxID=34010 RepID=UPI00040BB247|nr:hypothetical protein [Azospirillum halopraeferens]
MKAFSSALAFYLVAAVLTGLAFEYLFSVSAIDAFSLNSVRVEDHPPSLPHAGGGGRSD